MEDSIADVGRTVTVTDTYIPASLYAMIQQEKAREDLTEKYPNGIIIRTIGSSIIEVWGPDDTVKFASHTMPG